MKHSGLSVDDPWKLVQVVVSKQVKGYVADTISMINRDQQEVNNEMPNTTCV